MRDLILSPCLFNCRVSLNTGFYFSVYKWAWGCCIIKIFIPCFCITCSLFLFKVLSFKKKKKLVHNCCFPIQFCLLPNPFVWCFCDASGIWLFSLGSLQESTHPPCLSTQHHWPFFYLVVSLNCPAFQISLTYIFVYMLCLRPSFLSLLWGFTIFFLFLIMQCINISQGSIFIFFFLSTKSFLNLLHIHDLKYGPFGQSICYS